MVVHLTRLLDITSVEWPELGYVKNKRKQQLLFPTQSQEKYADSTMPNIVCFVVFGRKMFDFALLFFLGMAHAGMAVWCECV